MINESNPMQRRNTDGRYAESIKCDCCGKPVKDSEHVTDEDVCGGSDGPGFYLCMRKRCEAKRDAMTLEERTAHYTAQRAKNEAQ